MGLGTKVGHIMRKRYAGQYLLRKRLVNCTGICTTSNMVSRNFREYWQILGRLVRNS